MIMQKKFAVIVTADRGPCFTVRWQQWANILNTTAGGETFMLVLDEPLYDEYLLRHTAVVVISRPFLQKHIDTIKSYARLKNKFGFDLCVEMDDLLFSVQGRSVIPDFNPAPIDTDAVNASYREIKDLVDRWLPSTEFIAYALCKEFGIHPNKVEVLHNYCFTSCYWDEHGVHRNKKIDVWYGGSGCHFKDGMVGDFEGPWLEGIALAMEHGYIKFHAFGESKGVLPRGTILHEQVHAGMWASTISHYRPDVLIAPLVNCPFNKAKSPLKALEASAVGAVLVASVFPGSPYSGFTTELCSVSRETTVDNLVDIFKFLQDPTLRKACVKTQRDAVAGNGLIAETKPAMDKFVKTLFGRFVEVQ